jgi:hypothetical protein
LIKFGGLVVALVTAGLCSNPVPFTASVDAVASHEVKAGSTAQLVVKVTNMGPAIPHLGFVFRTADRWYERHKMTDLGGCLIATDASAFDCGDLGQGEVKTYSFSGNAAMAGAFHYEMVLRELVQPFDYVNDHPDGADAQVWDETVT